MKKLILPAFFLLFANFTTLNAQEQAPGSNGVFYTEISSLFRGNQSLNLSFERRIGKVYFGAGFDTYFNILNSERSFRDDAFNFGVFFKGGIDAVDKKPGFIQLGLYMKYAEFHIHQLDYEASLSRTPEKMVYRKDYKKITPMLYGQMNFLRAERVFVSIQGAYGYPIIFNVQSSLDETADIQLMDDNYSDYESDLIEHNIHLNRTGSGNQFSFQINALVGFRF